MLDLAGTGSTLFSGGLFWRQLRFGGNWLHIMFRRIVLEAAQIWRELASHIIFRRIVLRQLRFGGSWLHIIFRRIAFGGSSDLAGTGTTLYVLPIEQELIPEYVLPTEQELIPEY